MPALPGWELLTKKYPSRPVRELERGAGRPGLRHGRVGGTGAKTAFVIAAENKVGNSHNQAYAEAASDLIRSGRWDEIPGLRERFYPDILGFPVRFAIPDRDSWGNPDCDFDSRGGADSCPPPPVTGPAWPPFSDHAAGDVSVHACPDDVREFIAAAWSLLEDNRDILAWVTCLLYGVDYSSRISDRLASRPSVDITCHASGGTCNTDSVALSFPWLGTDICSSNWPFKQWGTIFRTGSDADRLCVVINGASLFAHELAHIVLTWRSGDVHVRECEHSYLLQNTFRWALLTRYPLALASECCRNFRESAEAVDQLKVAEFMSDNSHASLGREC